MSQVKFSQEDLERLFGRLRRVETTLSGRSLANTITAHARRLRNEAIERTSAELPTLARSTIRRRIELLRATLSRPEAVIEISRRPVNLARFGARQVAAGVAVALKGGRKLIRHAFIIRKATPLVVARATAGQKMFKGPPQVPRRPLVGIPGPSVGGVLRKHLDELLEKASSGLLGELVKPLSR